MLDEIQPHGTRPPLFLIHGIYNTIPLRAVLAAALGPDQPIYGLLARGFDGAAQPCESVKEMAAAYLPLIREINPTGPYLVAGMCHGGLVAIEITRELLVLNQKVA